MRLMRASSVHSIVVIKASLVSYRNIIGTGHKHNLKTSLNDFDNLLSGIILFNCYSEEEIARKHVLVQSQHSIYRYHVH